MPDAPRHVDVGDRVELRGFDEPVMRVKHIDEFAEGDSRITAFWFAGALYRKIRIAGGMTSVYRWLGIGAQWILSQVQRNSGRIKSEIESILKSQLST